MQTKPVTRVTTRSSFASATGGFVTTTVRVPVATQPSSEQSGATRR